MFCERTRLWRDTDQFNVTPDTCNVVCVPEGADLYEIDSAYVDGNRLEPIAVTELDDKWPRWREFDTGQAQWITQFEPGSLTIVPKVTGKLKLSLFLRPSNDADQLPDFIPQLYLQCIADGALAEIYMIPGQTFTDPSRAQFYAMRFENKLNELNNRTIKGQQRAPARTRAQFF